MPLTLSPDPRLCCLRSARGNVRVGKIFLRVLSKFRIANRARIAVAEQSEFLLTSLIPLDRNHLAKLNSRSFSDRMLTPPAAEID